MDRDRIRSIDDRVEVEKETRRERKTAQDFDSDVPIRFDAYVHGAIDRRGFLEKLAKVYYSAFTYPGTQHGFNNDTTPRYDEKAAKLAWQRTVDFFNANLRK